MSGPGLIERLTEWLAMLPIRLAYRLVWLVALTGSATGQRVYRAMWDSDLDLPPIRSITETHP